MAAGVDEHISSVMETAGDAIGTKRLEAEGKAGRVVGTAEREPSGARGRFAGSVRGGAGRASEDEGMGATGKAKRFKGEGQRAG